MSDQFVKMPLELMEILMSDAVSRNEARILLFIARKTYGYHKETDQISISQFQSKLHLSRQGVVSILKRLQLVKLCRLVNKGNSRLASSEWAIDLSDYPEKLVKLSGLVKFTPNKLVNIRRHTIDNITKEKHEGFAEVVISSNEKAWNEYSPAYLKSLGISDPQFIETARQAFISKAKAATQNAVKIFINNQKRYTPPDTADYKTDLWEGQNG